MKHRVGDTVLLVALLCACAALLYLDWRRQGEVELLSERVDKLQGFVVERFAMNKRTPESTVERILHASDDRTLADIAREGA